MAVVVEGADLTQTYGTLGRGKTSTKLMAVGDGEGRLHSKSWWWREGAYFT